MTDGAFTGYNFWKKKSSHC